MPSRTKGIVWQSGIITRSSSNIRTYHTLGHRPLYTVIQYIGGSAIASVDLKIDSMDEHSIVVSGPNSVKYRILAMI